MTIDHFRPKGDRRFSHLRVVYSNLYYCCGECNTYKSDKWPTQEQLDAGESFIDVCLHEWDDHLEIRSDVITGKTPIGRYTAEQVRLDRHKLTARNRSLRIKEQEIRADLARVDDIRRQLSSKIEADTARDLDELEQSRLADLRALLSPAPLEE